MKSTPIILISLMLVLSVSAQESGIGVGLSDDGLEGKYWMDDKALAIHWNLATYLSVDYLLEHDYDMVNISDNQTPVYYGAGVSLGTTETLNTNLEEETELDLHIRGVAGIAYHVSSMPIDIYLEIIPSIGVLGDTGVHVGSSFGFRYFF